ncbi:GIY-YIG nuclease family protein [Agrobacterium burrii]|uniref:GIY-YIG nuclease family protein n=1 Tax=Agrobacterium burrii TaxID=2815339 RepID=A0ABS3EKA0_9HYPH|nr:GIY-YIG nuclease family protein [Agrobacterium burrii]MBO0132426.1 GIY-YIG nuclease family protein [Agrobacterium burrii]
MTNGIFGLLSQPSALGNEQHTHSWQGRSGRWYITTVYPSLRAQIRSPSVYVMVRRDTNGVAHPLYIGQTSDTGRRMEEHLFDKVLQAMQLGGSELHVHLLARGEAERISIETDLRNGHFTPLNRQGSAVTLGGLLSLGSSYGKGESFLSRLGSDR